MTFMTATVVYIPPFLLLLMRSTFRWGIGTTLKYLSYIACSSNEEKKSAEMTDIGSTVNEAEELSHLRSMQDTLKGMSDTAIMKRMESVEGLAVMAVIVMDTKHKNITRKYYGDELLDDLAEVVGYDIRLPDTSQNEDMDRYIEEEDHSNVEEEYSKKLQAYVKQRKDKKELFKQEFSKKETIMNDEVIRTYILSRIATMNTEEFIEFVDYGLLFTGEKDFIQDLNEFVLKQEKSNREESASEGSSSMQHMAIGEHAITSSDGDLYALFKIIFRKAKAVLKEQVSHSKNVKMSSYTKISPNRSIRVTVVGVEPRDISVVLTHYEMKMKVTGFPVYDISFSNINFGQTALAIVPWKPEIPRNEPRPPKISKISHDVVKLVGRVRFEKCDFENEIFDLLSVSSEIKGAIKELRIIDCGSIAGLRSLEELGSITVFDKRIENQSWKTE